MIFLLHAFWRFSFFFSDAIATTKPCTNLFYTFLQIVSKILHKKNLYIYKMERIEDIIHNIQNGKPVKHINMKVNNTTPFIYYLKKNIKIMDKKTIQTIRNFTKSGASLYVADDRGVTPFYLLLTALGWWFDKDISFILMDERPQTLVYPDGGMLTSPMHVILKTYEYGRLDESPNYPPRRILRFMLENRIIDEPTSKLANRCVEAIRHDAQGYVYDIIRTVRMTDADHEKILNELVLREIDLSTYPELIHPGAVTTKIVLHASIYRNPDALEMLLPHILEKKNEILDKHIMSTYNENPNTAIVKQIWLMLLATGAVVSEKTMKFLIQHNRYDLVQLLYNNGSRLVLPDEIPSVRKTYNWVRKEMERHEFIFMMAERNVVSVKKPRKNQRLSKSVARQTSRMPSELILQLHQLMSGRPFKRSRPES